MSLNTKKVFKKLCCILHLERAKDEAYKPTLGSPPMGVSHQYWDAKNYFVLTSCAEIGMRKTSCAEKVQVKFQVLKKQETGFLFLCTGNSCMLCSIKLLKKQKLLMVQIYVLEC